MNKRVKSDVLADYYTMFFVRHWSSPLQPEPAAPRTGELNTGPVLMPFTGFRGIVPRTPAKAEKPDPEHCRARAKPVLQHARTRLFSSPQLHHPGPTPLLLPDERLRATCRAVTLVEHQER